jgi:hypothetical protein
MQKKKKRKKRGLDRRLLILFSIMPVGCLLAILLGLFIAWQVFPTRFVDAKISDLSPDQAQDIVVMVADDFAKNHDINRAKDDLLEKLKVPNPPQYVSLVAERMVRTHRGPIDQDLKNVVNLAEALGVSTVAMVAYVSTPTSTPTSTFTPTPTPTNTPVVPTSTPTPVVPTDTPAPTAEAPADTPAPAPKPAPAQPKPPTNTPEPTPTPKPEFDFIITKQRMLTKQENGGCLGNHNIFVTVLDAKGAPLKGVQMGDVWGNPGPVTGHKGPDQPGLAVYDLYKNALKIFIKSDPSAGKEVTSQITDLLSVNDWEIGIPKLLEAGYCPDEATCRVLWNSGVAGVGHNSLCWGHYSWEVTFQRAW